MVKMPLESPESLLPSLPYSTTVFGNCDKTVSILAYAAILLFVYFTVLLGIYGKDEMGNHDPLNRIVFPVTEGCCSSWASLHVLLFAVIGYLYPECFVTATILGVVWEFAEDFLGSLGITKGKAFRTNVHKVEYNDTWWAGSFKDIILNTVGFAFGAMLRYATDSYKSTSISVNKKVKHDDEN